jgi:hypothetical protein
VSNIQFSILLCPVVGVLWNEVSKLGESIHDHLDGVKLVGRERQTHNEIHADVFPFPGRNIQRLQQSGRSHMIGLDPSTHVAFYNIASGLMLFESTKIAPSDHDTSLCYWGGWNIWKCEVRQISSCATHGSLEPPNGP